MGEEKRFVVHHLQFRSLKAG